jgi:hypothetical protein
VIEVVDARDHVERPIPVLDKMVGEGLVTLEKVRVIKYVPGKRPLGPKR